jgi:hypothetical protein
MKKLLTTLGSRKMDLLMEYVTLLHKEDPDLMMKG